MYSLPDLPPVDLYLISEKINLENQVQQTGFLVYFELDFYCLCSLQKINLEIDFCMLKIQFVELDFSTLIFQNSSRDQQRFMHILVNRKNQAMDHLFIM